MKTKFYSFWALLLYSVLSLSLHSCSSDANEVSQTENKSVPDTSITDSTYFLFISDIHLSTVANAPSEYGVDTGHELWELMKGKVQEIMSSDNPPAFIVYTGDLPDHHPDSGELHDKNIGTVLDELVALAQGTPLFYAPGNNDPRGGDYFPYSDSTCKTPLDLADPEAGYPAPNSREIYDYNQSHGYYAASMYEDLRIIGLNSVMFSVSHQDSYPDHCKVDTMNQVEESLKQLAWLRAQFEAAQEMDQKVYMIMHIPPGNDAFKGVGMWKDAAWQDSLLVMAEEYESSISGMFFGHTHMDEIRRLAKPSNPSEFSVIAISAPGVSPIFKNNPGFKKVYINTDYEVKDFTTHYTSKVNNIWGVNGENWGDSLYTFREIYGTDGATVKEALSEMPLKNLFDKMMKIYMVKSVYPSGSPYIEQGIDVEPSK